MDDLPERINVSALSETDRQEVENFLKGTNQQLSVNKSKSQLPYLSPEILDALHAPRCHFLVMSVQPKARATC